MSWTDKHLSDDRYRVIRPLGAGGMADVYLARDANLDADVVIKVPRPVLLAEPGFAERFRREVWSLIQLAHPHIVRIQDLGVEGGVPFAVMQYLAGGSLEDRPLAAATMQTWLPQVCNALDFIHSQGFVHRDIKPGNILLDAQGNAYVSDFGIVKAVAAGERETRRDATLTRTGMVLGTPDYMAPELIMGQAYDGRADQYSLAVMLHELFAGQRPFDGPTPAAVLVQHTVAAPPDLRAQNPRVSAAVASAIRRGLEKKPDVRFPTCEALAHGVLSPELEGVTPPVVAVRLKTVKRTGSHTKVVSARATPQPSASAPPPAKPPRPPWTIQDVGQWAAKAVRSADDSLKRAVGEKNDILHQFLRVVVPLACAGFLVLAVWWLRSESQPSPGSVASRAEVPVTETLTPAAQESATAEAAPAQEAKAEAAAATAGNGQDTPSTKPDSAPPALNAVATEMGGGDAKAKTESPAEAKARPEDSPARPAAGKFPAEKPSLQPAEKLPPAEKKAPLPGKKPFADLPAVATLPAADAADATQPKVLGSVYIPDQELCFIRLRGGEQAYRGTQTFVMRNANGGLAEREWEIFGKEAAVGETKAAHVRVDDQARLTFQWEPGGKNLASAPYLTNCAFSLSCAGESHVVTLRQPAQAEELVVDFESSVTKQDWEIANCPAPEAVHVEIVDIEGVKFTVESAPIMLAENLSVWIKIEDGGGILSLKLETTIKENLQVSVTPYLKMTPDTQPEKFNRRAFEEARKKIAWEEQSWASKYRQGVAFMSAPGVSEDQKHQARPHVTHARAELASRKDLLERMKKLDVFLKSVATGLRVNLRVFFDADTSEVTLLNIGAHTEAIRPSAKAMAPLSAVDSSATAPFAGDSSKPEMVSATPDSAATEEPKTSKISPGFARPRELVNSVGVQLVLIQPGDFLMGSPDSDGDAKDNEKPQHRVRITKPFYLSAYEVTQAQYQRLIAVNPSHFVDAGESAPVENVSWDDAQEFCVRLTALPEEQRAGRHYRLPTEAEWEYACRAGSTTRYGFGESSISLGDYAWYEGNSGRSTHSIGQKKPNGFGLYDMHGNVSEWCQDGYLPNHGDAITNVMVDPIGPERASARVVRGGGWSNVASACRTAGRSMNLPWNRTSLVGFRLVCVQIDPRSTAAPSTEETR